MPAAQEFFLAMTGFEHTCASAHEPRLISAASIHLCHPNLLGPSVFINSVLPTNHLFDHPRP
jgi:hypothetical protein